MRDVPVTYEYLLRRRKTRPRLGEPLARELVAYSQAIAQLAERLDHGLGPRAARAQEVRRLALCAILAAEGGRGRPVLGGGSDGAAARLDHGHGVALGAVLAVAPAIPASALQTLSAGAVVARALFPLAVFSGPVVALPLLAGTVVPGPLVPRPVVTGPVVTGPVIPLALFAGTVVPRPVVAWAVIAVAEAFASVIPVAPGSPVAGFGLRL